MFQFAQQALYADQTVIVLTVMMEPRPITHDLYQTSLCTMFSIECLEYLEFLNNGVTLLVLIDNFVHVPYKLGCFPGITFLIRRFAVGLQLLVNFEKKLS